MGHRLVATVSMNRLGPTADDLTGTKKNMGNDHDAGGRGVLRNRMLTTRKRLHRASFCATLMPSKSSIISRCIREADPSYSIWGRLASQEKGPRRGRDTVARRIIKVELQHPSESHKGVAV